MKPRTINDVLRALAKPKVEQLATPRYHIDCDRAAHGFALAVQSMKDHTSDEGWQLMLGLEAAGYRLYGAHLDHGQTDVRQILQREQSATSVVVQDKKEWCNETRAFRDRAARFRRIERLTERSDLFRMTVLRDAHFNPAFHREAGLEMSCHAWVVPYAPRVVSHLAPYTRPQHLIRSYHSIDPDLVPDYCTYPERRGALLSGAMSAKVYPLREKIRRCRAKLPKIDHLAHPGYHRKGTNTPEYLKTLSRYKVAVCTSSIYGYALRKIVEATACGCVVLTDLPTDEVLPVIDGNLVRVHPQIAMADLAELLKSLYRDYDSCKQLDYAERCMGWYAYQRIGQRLADDIEELRLNYGDSK